MRPKSSNKDLPPRMLRRTKTLKGGKVWVGYYYNGRDDSGKRVEVPLGSDLDEAKRLWAKLDCKSLPPKMARTMGEVFDRYICDVLPQKAPRTQQDNRAEMEMLRKVFERAPIDQIATHHLAQYRDNRKSQAKGHEGKPALVRANREISLFSHAFNMAREWGYTDRENPCRGLRKNKEQARDFYADDMLFGLVLQCAPPELQDAMQLAYLTGQRPADVRKMRWADIEDSHLIVRQNKTRKKLRIAIVGDLAELLERIRSRPVLGMHILSNGKGRPLSYTMMRKRFESARDEASKRHPELAEKIAQFQFRDIRAKSASDTDVHHASALLGHSSQKITEDVYRRQGQTVKPTK